MPARAFVHLFSYFRGPGVGKPVAKTQIPSKARLSGAQIDKGARLKERCASAAGEGFGGPCPETFTRSHRRKRSGAIAGRAQRGRAIERALHLGCGRRFRGPLPRNLRPQPSAKNAVTQETTPQDSIFNQLFQLFNFFDDRSSTFELLNFSGIPNPTFELFDLLNFLEVSHLNF